MNREEEIDLTKKVDEIHALLCRFVVSKGPSERLCDENCGFERAIKKAIDELEKTKSAFRSRRIMEIKEDLERALAGKH